MLASVRIVAALFLFASTAFAADKEFQRNDLDDAALRLEAQIKADATPATKPLATLRTEADAAFQKNDARTGLSILGQIVATAPADGANWLRLARSVMAIRTNNERDRSFYLERATAASYIAYQRARTAPEEADALLTLGRSFNERKLYRPALDSLRLSLERREVAEVRQQYERLRDEHGFRVMDYSVDSDVAAPRACFQFSEEIGKRVDLSPFVAVAGQDKPAVTIDEKQVCVEGLKHGERYTMTLRTGLPSVVRETLQKTAEYNIYVRDRSPFARFTGKAYVLPRAGQRGIPVVTVNTRAVAVAIYRVGDRNLTDTVLGTEFQRNLDRYEVERLSSERGTQLWKGELAVESTLNAEITTAFPVTDAIGELAPGVYAMTAEPTGPRADDFGSVATQWFIVSDLGLTAYSGNDGIHVFVNSLATTAANASVQVRLIARNNEVLATRQTDANGRADFEPGLARGEGGLSPAMVIATLANDYAFLSLKTPAFDLTDRGVTGRETPAGLDAFVFTERGVYRSGETVHITALLRDAQANATPDAPLTLVVERPDGVEHRRAVLTDMGIGGRSLDLPLVASASTGTWRVRAYTDPKRPSIGEVTFLVEDYVPDRLEFTLATTAKSVSKAAKAEITLDGRYLYGAPASDLDIEGEVVISAASARPGFAGYVFGPSDEDVETVNQPLEDLPDTDSAGKARISVGLDTVPDTTRPLEAKVILRLAEPGGRAVERSIVLPVTPAAPMIGVKPLFEGRSLGEGANATFDVVFANPDGASVARRGLRYELLNIETRYQFYKREGSWNYEPVKTTRRVAEGQFDVAAGQPARLSLPVQWGRYRLEVSSTERNGPTTSVGFDAGFYAEASADTPDLLEIALDKPEYQPGDSMTVAVTARTAGRVSLNIFSDRLLATVTQDVPQGTAQIRVPVGRDWGSGAYAVATLRRPLDAQAQRMPGRSIGVQWFAVGREARKINVALTLPQLIRPNSTLKIPVKLTGLAAGEQARIVVSAVDVGILNLTNYKPPSPEDHYLGQRKLSAELRDLYGQLIDGMQGARGAIRTGGDGGNVALQGSPPAQKPLALYSGIVTVGADGSAEVSFEIPDFAGTARVMAVAWSKDRVGQATGDVTIRDPVVLTATLPRFLLTGDRGTLHVDLDNVEGQAGQYNIAVVSEGLTGGDTRMVQLNAKQRSGLSLPISATRAGNASVSIRVTGPGGFTSERNYALGIRPATQIATRRTVRPIAKGESITLSNDLFADLVPGTGSVALSVGLSTALDAAALLAALDRYPFGCSEQTVSRALPLLYVNDLAAGAQLALDGDLDQRIRDSIDRVLARQGSNGSFGLWSPGGDDIWLDAYVSDFLTRAKERNFAIPDVAFKLALDRLKNYVGNAPEPSKDGGSDLAYALYVLARNGNAPVGDLRYFVDAKLADFTTVTAKAQLAAALGMMGDRGRAERVYASALGAIPQQPALQIGRTDYGSILRDAAALVTLAGEGNAPRPTILAAVARIETARPLTQYTSTQENAWLVLAARAIARDAGNISLVVSGEKRTGAFYRRFGATGLTQPLTVANTGEGDLQAVVSVSGAPLVAEPAAERGFKIERSFHNTAGETVDVTKAKQNDRIVVLLKMTEAQPQFGRIMVADYLPAGFEIENPRLVSSGETGTLEWIDDAVMPAHAEFRDDRFTAAFDRSASNPAVFTVAYVVRAVSPGRYVLPQAIVEDMYRPDRFGRTGTGNVEVTAAR